jgi:hypothetical protein
MIKQFSAGDIITRPFKTFKNWQVQSVDVNGVDQFGRSTYFVSSSEVNRGQKIETIFYPSGSPKYNPVLEPMTPNGKYERNVYSLTDAMFYRNPTNPMELFGVENSGTENEVREIHNKIVSLRIAENYWGEKIVPKSVKIIDNSNLHATYKIYDDGMTNLYITGSQFGESMRIGAFQPMPPLPYWNTSSGKFYATIQGEEIEVSVEDAKRYMDMGVEVSYFSGSNDWVYDYSASRDYYQPENERFGQSVSCWYKYIAVGSPMDDYSLSDCKQGYVVIHKYNDEVKEHQLIKRFIDPLSQESLALEFGSDNSNLLMLENGAFLSLESGSFSDGFGYSVSVKDNFLAIGAPESSGSVYVYDRFQGGSDNWGLINILTGSLLGDRFGNSVSIDGDVLAVGVPGANEVRVFRLKKFMDTEYPCRSIPTSSGAPEYMVGKFSWEHEATISSSFSQAGDKFGWTLETNGNKILVGNRKTSGDGYATLFECTYVSASFGDCPTASWVESVNYVADESIGDLNPLDTAYSIQVPLSYDGFGWSVAMNGDNLAIGSYYDKAFLPYIGAPTASYLKVLGAVYFYHNYPDEECGEGTSSFNLVQKTFGPMEYTSSSNFGRKVSIDGMRAAVSSEPSKVMYSVDYNAGFILESSSYQSINSDDVVLGRVSMYSLQTDYTWNRVGDVRRNKEQNQPFGVFGRGLSMSSDFLAVGSPIYNYATGSNTASILDHNIQISEGMSPMYSGSVFVYDTDDYAHNTLIGNVFYKNGYVVITNTASNYSDILTSTGSRGFDMTYRGTHTIYENEYLISVRPGEFNYSTNPTSLVDNSLLFDVNQDGVFDLDDINLIMRYLEKKKFYSEYTLDDNGIVLEQDNRLTSWWNNDILLTEGGDVLLQESDYAGYLASSSFTAFTKTAFDYIETKLDKSGIIDIDGDGKVNLNDGAILVAYFTHKLTPVNLLKWINTNSTRRYVVDVEDYIGRYTGQQRFDTDPRFFGYQASSSYDPTGSYLAPYITTIGLYDNNQLVGVAKLGKPIKNLIDWPINFIVRFDT